MEQYQKLINSGKSHKEYNHQISGKSDGSFGAMSDEREDGQGQSFAPSNAVIGGTKTFQFAIPISNRPQGHMGFRIYS